MGLVADGEGGMSVLQDIVALATDRYRVRLARHAEDITAAQRLRYAVFNLELNEGLAESAASGRDADPFDDVCDHLLVTDRTTEQVVGTYRMQTGPRAGQQRGYYSEQEFDFAPFEPARAQILELGRACVAAAHRNQVVLGLLWKGIAGYARDHGARYLVGCSSLTSQDETAGLATYELVARTNLVESRWRTSPRPAWRCRPGPAVALPVPRLMAAYLAIGAMICGEPAIDREFGTIDFLTWLDLDALPERVQNKYLR
ncbi:MAG TPA: GNAT family N-acyltransferase [Candidatus Synoicihabitans sp.]|nr:GNAT family N-acyltransferase [Candidatus Synoicihabitans sp.]